MAIIMILLFFLVWTLVVSAIEITNHINAGLGTRDSIPIQNQILMTLTRTSFHAALSEDFLTQLESMAEQDGCLLTFSGKTNTELVLSFHCPALGNKDHHAKSLEGRAPLPLMESTVTLLKQQNYEVDHMEYMQRIKRPSWEWHGSAENLNAVYEETLQRREDARRAARRGKAVKPRTIIHGKYTQYPVSWGLDRIDMRYGPRDNTYNYDNVGEDADVYVVDTGIRVTHNEFQGRATFLVNTAGDSVDTDCAGHGTHVASVIGGKTYGVAKNVSLWAVKVLDCGGNGDTFTIVAGSMAIVEHAATRGGRRAIASASLGGQFSISINNAFLSLLVNNITVIVAAGNEYSDACDYSPGVLGQTSNVVTVGASTAQDTRPPFSNYGACVSISAPGAEIIGAYHTSNSATAILSGTSMATPFVSGVAALVLTQNLSLTVGEVKTKLLAWATPSIVTGASSSGGGKNLLFSLIHVDEIPNIVSPPPTLLPVPNPFTGGGDFSSGTSSTLFITGPSLLLTLSFILFYLGMMVI